MLSIDPWGLALENFDAVGAWRTSEAACEDPSLPQKRKEGDPLPAFAINADLELPIMSDRAKHATGLDAVRVELLRRQEDFALGFTEKMMTYALGRSLVISDHKQVEAVIAAFKKDDYRLHALLRAFVLSPTFQSR